MPTSQRSDFRLWSRGVSLIRRTAVCGPACTVVWQGRRGNPSPYADTLHGGSGTDDEDFRRAIAAGINIIHINTELRVAWRQSLEESLGRDPNEVAPYKILQPVVDSVRQVVSSRLILFHGEPVGAGAVGSVA
jgi:hypothetical protein